MYNKHTRFSRNLRRTQLGDELLEAVASECPKLERFVALGCDNVSTAAWEKFGQESRFLRSLEIHGFYTAEAVFPPLESFTALQSLTLICMSYPRDPSPICHSSSLTSLTVSHITDAMLCTLTAASSSISSLQSLKLIHSDVSSSLLTLSSFTGLTTLSFQSCDEITHTELQYLSKSIHSLSGLAFVQCKHITEDGVKAVVGSNPALRSLSLQLYPTASSTRDKINAMLDCCQQLETLTLTSFHTCQRVLLTDLSCLQSLTLGSFEGKLEGLVRMLVRPEGWGRKKWLPKGWVAKPAVGRSIWQAKLSYADRVKAKIGWDLDDPQSAELIHPPLKSLTLEKFSFCGRNTLASMSAPCSDPAARGALPVPETTRSSIDEALGGIQWQAAFKDLRSLTLDNSSALGEGGLVALLQACTVLKELTICQNVDVSDTVIHSCPIASLERLTLVQCERVTTAGIDGAWESFPRLRCLRVEAGKVSRKTLQALLRLNVIVKRV
ncbi:hypothetical protein CLOM_g20876 [Closterium sp. NIES-68]|nr:hypothetical protein CLOM_g20876 [Closterium sp. NIES-68]GJP68502.1 hypothetical protein CLOP_g25200 [Closterium sp. NIES-67]